MNEQWRPIHAYPYEVSNLGRVRRIGAFHPLKPICSVKRRGIYQQVNLWKWNKSRTCYIHRLVALYFLPEPEPFQREVDHLDENPSNNHVENLEWCTREQNEQHKRYMRSFKELG